MDYKLGRLIILGVLCILISVILPIPAVADVKPQFDVTGIWQTGKYSYPFFQNGTEVTAIHSVPGYGHLRSGKFISPTQFKGIMTRRQKSNGCVTKAEITFNMTSNSTMTEDQIYLDSNCEIQKGARFSFTYTRVE